MKRTLMRRLIHLLFRSTQFIRHSLGRWKYNSGRLQNGPEQLRMQKGVPESVEDWEEEQEHLQAEAKREDDESHGRYADWKQHYEAVMIASVIQEIFYEFSDYELEFFRDHVIAELESDHIFADRVVSFVAHDSARFSKWNLIAELEMHSELCKAFAFMYNRLMSYVSKDNSNLRLEAIGYNYKRITNRSFLDGYEYEVRRRFAESLELELPKDNKPRTKRAKI